MSSSRIPAVLEALTAQLGAALDIPVVDGPPPQAPLARALYIGWTPELGVIDFSQSWAGQGHQRRNESITIPNTLQYQSGNEVSRARATTFGYLTQVEDLLRADPTLGLVGFTTRAQFGEQGTYLQSRTPALLCRVTFTITVDVRI